MRHYYNYILIALLGLGFASCQTEEEIAPQTRTEASGINFEAIVPATTKVIETEKWESMNSVVDTIQSTITLENPSSEGLNLEPGDILASGEDGGYLLTVGEIETVNGKTVIHTTDASLEEAIEDVDMCFDMPLNAEDIEETVYHTDGVRMVKNPLKATKTNILTVSINKEFTKDTILSLGVHGELEIKPTIKAKLKIKRFKLRTFELGFQGSTCLNIGVDACAKKEVEIEKK